MFYMINERGSYTLVFLVLVNQKTNFTIRPKIGITRGKVVIKYFRVETKYSYYKPVTTISVSNSTIYKLAASYSGPFV